MKYLSGIAMTFFGVIGSFALVRLYEMHVGTPAAFSHTPILNIIFGAIAASLFIFAWLRGGAKGFDPYLFTLFLIVLGGMLGANYGESLSPEQCWQWCKVLAVLIPTGIVAAVMIHNKRREAPPVYTETPRPYKRPF